LQACKGVVHSCTPLSLDDRRSPTPRFLFASLSLSLEWFADMKAEAWTVLSSWLVKCRSPEWLALYEEKARFPPAGGLRIVPSEKPRYRVKSCIRNWLPISSRDELPTLASTLFTEADAL